MASRFSAVFCGLAAGILSVGLGSAWGQNGATGRPEVVPAPSPQRASTPPAAPRQYHPEITYGPLDAAEEARLRADEAGQAAINRQLQLLDDIRWYNTWLPTPYRPTLPYIYGYGPPRVARRAYRDALDPVFTPWPQVPGDIYGYPYYGTVKQPIGHEKIWTSPNSYIYRPVYAPPAGQAAAAPRVAAPGPYRATPAAPTLAPAAGSPGQPVPPPAGESGPREF